MTRSERNSLFALPIVLLVAAGVAFATGRGGTQIVGIPVTVFCVALAFLMQWLAFIPAFAVQTERFFDLTGSLTYISIATIAFISGPGRDLRSIVLYIAVVVWALRLGSFLMRRVHSAGSDGRFDELKPSFPRFLNVWTLQGLWVSLTLSAALVGMTSVVRPRFGVVAIVGAVVWIIGFAIEAVADAQKRHFKRRNDGAFITTGLWAWSRHPNYFGEIMLWSGIVLIAAPVFRGWQWVALISPVFVTLLLMKVSGIPMLERRADERWGGTPEYDSYKERTPVLILRPPPRKG